MATEYCRNGEKYICPVILGRIKAHCPTSYCDAGKGRNAKRDFGQEMGPMVCGSTDFECYRQRKINLSRLPAYPRFDSSELPNRTEGTGSRDRWRRINL